MRKVAKEQESSTKERKGKRIRSREGLVEIYHESSGGQRTRLFHIQ